MYRKTILDNGMRIISEEIDHVRSVSIGIWVECGSRYEDEESNGTAHFIEHMLFKGTDRRSAFDIAADIDSVGGIMNAFTSKELTSFYIKIPDYHLELALDLLADIFINSRFDDQEILKEKSVVLQEISMLEDSPDDYIHDFFEANFWQADRLGMPVLGARERVEGFTRDSLRGFFHHRYRGRRVILTAAGRLQHDRLVALADRAFGALAGEAEPWEFTTPVVSANISVLEKDLEQAHLMIGTLAPSSRSERRHAAFLMNAVLGGSMSSRLFQEIREKRGLAYAVHSYITPYMDTGLLAVYVGTGKEETPEVLGLIFNELMRLTGEGLVERELRGAKELIKGNFLLSMESTDNRMSRLAKNEICFGRHVPPEEVTAAIDAVTEGDVLALARELFNPSTISISAIGPVSERDLTLHVLNG
ncbi:MAG: pitrilysin family protein [Pseudomonadota bacterium]|nr:pitrilysin family protein [Pseudomonadota bacterium]